MIEQQDEFTSAIQLFQREDSTISIWDHPNFKSHVVLPDDCYSITRAEQGLELMHQGRLSEDAIMVMKIIGDAMCANENQLRRYLSKKISFSQTSLILKKLRKYRFVERFKSRLAFIEEEGEEVIRPPAPYTLGIAGIKLMKHLYPEVSFATPEMWQNPLAVQRFVAMNEFRCLAVEAKALRGWKWNPFIGGSSKHMKPMAVATVESGQGLVHMLLERPQMAQNFIGYLRSKLELYRYLYERDGVFKLDGLGTAAMQSVCLYVSSSSMAKYIHEEISLQHFPFDIWILVDEWIDEEKGMSEAFCIPNNHELKRIRLSFFKPGDS